jgi:dTDP-4-dehydrorhamnose 3,5-epimerase
MKASRTALGGVWIIEPRVFSDARGFFFETYQEARFAELGIITRFVQDNHSRSIRGSLRGLHYQLHHPQAKLCRVVIGEVVDVVADIRQGSPTFGKWILKIDWTLQDPVLSSKDRNLPMLSQIEPAKLPIYRDSD